MSTSTTDTLATALATRLLLTTAPPPAAKKRSGLLALPAELRLQIYSHLLHLPNRSVIDLDPTNYRAIAPLLALLHVNRQLHHECTHYFYHTNSFRLFPTHGRFFPKKPLVARLTPDQRSVLRSLELRLGPGWNAPPASWKVDESLGLGDMRALKEVKVFVECDPDGDPTFEGWRKGDGFYGQFCAQLLRGVMEGVPQTQKLTVKVGAWESVKRSSPLIRALEDVVEERGDEVVWEGAGGKIVDEKR